MKVQVGDTLYYKCIICNRVEWGMARYTFYKGKHKSLVFECNRCGLKTKIEDFSLVKSLNGIKNLKL